MNKYSLISIIFLLTVGLIFRIFNLSNRYTFDWDQADDATKVMEMISTQKPRLIGPRVANDNGFFVGPFHYYFLLLYYYIMSGSPMAGAYAAITMDLVSILAFYLILKSLYNSKIAFLSAFFIAVSPSVTSWNVMYTSTLSIIILYLCHKIVLGRNSYLPLLFFTYSFASTTHLVPISLIFPILTACLLSSSRPKIKFIIFSIIFAFIPLIPLIIFDLRHDFINLKSMLNFAFSSKTNFENPPYLFLRSFWRSVNYINTSFDSLQVLLKIVIISISLFTISSIKNNKHKILYLVWLFTPLVLLSFYKGNIPEYYYGASNIVIPILLAIFISRYHISIYIIIVFMLIFSSYKQLLQPISQVTLKNKIQLVSFLVNQKQDLVFNVSYDLPVGWSTGYEYIFKYLGKSPQNVPQGHLYTVYLLSSHAPSGDIVYRDNILGLVRK